MLSGRAVTGRKLLGGAYVGIQMRQFIQDP